MLLPHPSESRSDFADRCFSDAAFRAEYPEPRQRMAATIARYEGKAAGLLDDELAIFSLDRLISEQHERKSQQPEWKQLHRIADKAEPQIRRSLLKAVAKTQGEITLAEVTRAIQAGDFDRAVDAIPWKTVGERIVKAEVLRVLRDAFDDAGETAASLIEGAKFDVIDPRGLEFLREHGASLVKGLNDDNRAALRETVARIYQSGMNAQDGARLIKAYVGLTPRLAKAVDNYRFGLLAAGASSKAAQQAAEAKAKTLHQYRAMMIARTESAFATNNGQHEAFLQAADDGMIDPEVAVRAWVTTLDDVADHDPPNCADLNGQTAKLDEPFVLTGRNGERIEVMMPPLHPGCRCAVSLRGEG